MTRHEMTRREDRSSRSEAGPPPASTAILFLFGSFGLFYGLIAVVDPFL